MSSNGFHIHTHCEESTLDGLSKIKELVAKAKSLGQSALGLTDHGVCSGLADFIQECNKQGIKPIPGMEAYTTKDRKIQSDELLEMRNNICYKYKITDNKGKPKMKMLKDFIKKVKNDHLSFDLEVHSILKDFLMDDKEDLQEELNLFADNLDEDPLENPSEFMTAEEKIEAFRKDILNYLDHGNFHMVLLAINNQGLEDLYKISSDAHLNGFYSDPRTDLTFIRENNLGSNIIATSACLGSYFSQLCMQERFEEAKAHIEEAKQTFHSFYLEKQATSIPEQQYVNSIIDQLSVETNTPKILTTDVHYANKEDHHIHDILVASGTKKCISDENRMKYAHEYWLKSEEEMLEKCNDPEAWSNTLKIAELVNVHLPKEPLFPKFPVQEGDTSEEILRKKSWNGLFELSLRDDIDIDEYSKRLQYELDVICSEGFADYFLIDEDMIKATVNAGYLVGPGRGSAAGSLVCYVLEITWLDPIKNGLLFERFLNPERAGYPDIDTDYGYEASQWVQRYLKKRYGELHVAQIGTKGTLAARAVCRRVGKTLGYDIPTQNAFAKSIPERPGITLKEAFKEESKVREYAETYPNWWEAMLALEGHISQVGVHAGGIVLSPEPLTKVVPLRKDSVGLATTQYDMGWIEKFLVKFDILKLDTLDYVKDILLHSGLHEEVNIYRDIDVNDPKIFEEVYQKLNLSGIFQCESDLFRGIIEGMKPTSFSDISVIVALGRPGPLDLIPSYINRKWGKEEITYPFDELQPVLEETYGIWVYQEQLMQASQILGGLTLGQADMIRKGVSKKKEDLMNRWIDLMIYGSEEYKRRHGQLVQKYPEGSETNGVWVDYEYESLPEIEGAIARGFDEETLLEIKKQWIKFGSYCFNKAHSACYAFLSCITAWLKAYYPVEFMAALMSIAEGKKDKNGNAKNIHYMKECDSMGIRILPPDVNESLAGWTPKTYEQPMKNEDGLYIGEIRYGLSSIAKISGESVNEIIEKRPYYSLEDLLEKTNGKKINKTKIEALIKSGSLDSINKNRNLLLRNYFKSRGEEYDHIPSQTSKATIIAYEKDYFGTTITSKSKWEKVEEEAETQITGVIRAIDEWTAKSSGKKHFHLVVDTQEETIEVTLWGYLKERYKEAVQLGNKIRIKGQKSRGKLTAKTVTIIENIHLNESQFYVEIPV